jgi:hypothetical protein
MIHHAIARRRAIAIARIVIARVMAATDLVEGMTGQTMGDAAVEVVGQIRKSKALRLAVFMAALPLFSCITPGEFEDLSGLDQRMSPRFSPFHLADLSKCGEKIDEACEKAAPMFTPTPGKPMFVEFYFARCAPCWGNRWAVEEMADKLAGKVDVVELSIDCEADDYSHWIAGAKKHVPVLYGCEAEIVDELNIQRFPTGILFDGDGKVILRHRGQISKERLRVIISKAIESAQK